MKGQHFGFFLCVFYVGTCASLDVNVSTELSSNNVTLDIFVGGMGECISPNTTVVSALETSRIHVQLTICPGGYWCPTLESIPTPCPAGTFSPPGSANATGCEDCPKGHVCPEATQTPLNCSEGTFRNASRGVDFTNCDECSTGGYCPNGSVTPITCPAGTFRDISSGISLSDCFVCPQSYYCAANSSYPTVCGTAGYCPNGSFTPTHCPAGTYRNIPSGISVSDCFVCPAGSWCVENSPDPTPCVPGTFSSYGQVAFESTVCQPCDFGYYCPNEGLVPPKPCLSGSYSASQGAWLSPVEAILPR